MDAPTFCISAHDKRPGTIELRAFVLLANGSPHRIGTWCVSGLIYRTWLRRLLVQGAAGVGVELLLDESRAARETQFPGATRLPK
ncbi:MAG: hypothetical protein V4617_15045 [Gemmatimonadota bacterium]